MSNNIVYNNGITVNTEIQVGDDDIKDVLQNPSAYNSLILFDDQSSNTTDFSTINTPAAGRSTVSGYIELLNGQTGSGGAISWPINPGNTFILEYDLWIQSDFEAADGVWFGFFLNKDASTLNQTMSGDDGGYKIGFDVYGGTPAAGTSEFEAYHAGVNLNTTSMNINSYTGQWVKIRLTYIRGNISMYIDNELVKKIQDQERTSMYDHDSHIAFGCWSGGYSNIYRIRNIKLYKLNESIWVYNGINDIESISFLGKGVGINNRSAGVSQEFIVGDPIAFRVNISDGILDTILDVGINDANPACPLHIKQTSENNTGGLRLERSGTTNQWSIFVTGSSNLDFNFDGSGLGYLATSGSNTQMNFTGQHRCFTNNNNINNNISNYIGLIVSATGSHKNLNNDTLDINNAIPIIELSDIDNDKKVIGVISDKEDNNSERVHQNGIFATIVQKDVGDERIFVNSIGEGMVWICNKGGNLTTGDLITTSSAIGYGQMQAGDLLKNYTVGKITQDCNFTSPERYIDLLGTEVTQTVYDSDPVNHYKCNYVGCVYYCG
jgi:hypothetical protein